MGGKFKTRRKTASKPRRRRSKYQVGRNDRRGTSQEPRVEQRLKRRYKYVFRKSRNKGVKVRGYIETSPGPGQPKRLSLSTATAAEGDWVVGDDLDDLFVVESKVGRDSKFRPPQEREYKNINARGGQIVEKKPLTNLVDGGEHDLFGRELRPKNTVTIYQSDLVALENGSLELDDMVANRKGVLRPTPTPYHMPPASLEGKPPGASGSGSRGTSERGTGRPGTGGERGGAAGAQNRGTAPTRAKAPSRQKLLGDPAHPSFGRGARAPNVRPRAGRMAFRAVKGALLDALGGIAAGLIVAYFESKIAEETQASIRREWGRKVFPRVAPYLERAVARERTEPASFRKHPLYVAVSWTLVVQEQDEEVADVAVWALKLIAESPGFVELFDHLEVQKEPKLVNQYFRRGERPETTALKRRRDPRRNDWIRYGFLQWVLVWDPQVHTVAEVFRASVKPVQETLRGVDKARRSLDRGGVLDAPIERVREALETFDLAEARSALKDLRKVIYAQDQSWWKLNGRLWESERALQKSDALQVLTLTLDAEQKTLLTAFLGGRPTF